MDEKSKQIITEAVIVSLSIGGTTSLIQTLPVANFITIVYIYWGGISANWITLLVRLFKKYDYSINQVVIAKLVNAIVQSYATFLVGQGIFTLISSFFPGLGTLGATGANCFIAAYITYLFGETSDGLLAKKEFDIEDIGQLAKTIVRDIATKITPNSLKTFSHIFDEILDE
ncbi:hypothetical protein [Gloeothece verrucosa]|nr:hypothetical protein [Gloeothece verrucosa]